MHIQWGEMLQVFGATVAATALLVTLFSVGVRGLGKRSGAGKGEGSTNVSDAGPVLSFVLSFAIVIYGIYLIVAK
ncbi:hypothetical protein ORV05_08905 [Amycolatopsis cynarae]|uniref:Secreted protein n=1 Tax=Amycolatopsis cynarae TaxID=2995223 RepID=A0ABY7B9P6_9PSEU|nr:hypothetical protein [Amycolatopsis sp. HUAS 11-8]WAL67873.1 hypothetical protein ORV05_08905 [Amycolatopsis sp. HUAS 11-8]